MEEKQYSTNFEEENKTSNSWLERRSTTFRVLFVFVLTLIIAVIVAAVVIEAYMISSFVPIAVGLIFRMTPIVASILITYIFSKLLKRFASEISRKSRIILIIMVAVAFTVTLLLTVQHKYAIKYLRAYTEEVVGGCPGKRTYDNGAINSASIDLGECYGNDEVEIIRYEPSYWNRVKSTIR